jgi:alanine-glyoxylate transaminase/serine-glyoxylate transaminase/serine-pyruvate transaminase
MLPAGSSIDPLHRKCIDIPKAFCGGNMDGWHFLQIPGPTNVPQRILRAIAQPTIDHRGKAFGEMGREIRAGLKHVFGTQSSVLIFPGSGTGAWEAALVNTLSPGDRVLMCETGHFASLWQEMAGRLGLQSQIVPTNWRSGANVQSIAEALHSDRSHSIRAVCVVHNETSTGCRSDIAAVRKAMDDAGHPALLLVDTISSLGSSPYLHDEWGVDVSVGCSQKGLMLPPGLGFNAVSARAIEASRRATSPKSYWSWQGMLETEGSGHFPYTPSTNLLFGLREALAMLSECGLETIWQRHALHARATRAAVRTWGLELVCSEPEAFSHSLTAVMMPEGHSADQFRAFIEERFNMALGNGLGRYKDRVFRIGHLGDFNDLMLAGTLSGIEMALGLCGIPHRKGGVQAALDVLQSGASGDQPAPVRDLQKLDA